MSNHDQVPSISESQRRPLVEQLLEKVEQLLMDNWTQAEQILRLPDEIAIVQPQKAEPEFKPNGMDTATGPGGDDDGHDEADDGWDDGVKRQPNKRSGSSRRSETQRRTIHETFKVVPKLREVAQDQRRNLLQALANAVATDTCLKETCCSLGISFRDYLGYRIGQLASTAPLRNTVCEHAPTASPLP